MIIGNVEPSSPQENANRKWQELGEKYGFKWETVEPTGNGDNYFLAEPK
jgi:predicted TIM-barrel fold metal-dependent hydrolase